MVLKQYGLERLFTNGFDNILATNLGRITAQHNKIYTIICESGERRARVSGKFIHGTALISDFPVVGDWVQLRKGSDGTIIESVAPRINRISRSAAGNKGARQENVNEQVIAANVDNVFIVSGLDRDFNLRRIERYLTLAYSSGSKPFIILNKADLCDDVEFCITQIQTIAFGVPVYVVSAIEQSSLKSLSDLLKIGETSVLIGSSGVGKSTLINALSGMNRQAINGISKRVNKGKHTTTHRELFLLPNGSILIDNPGMRELGLHDGSNSIEDVFSEIETLAKDCRFNDYNHEKEPGCAVQDAVKKGAISHKRFENYVKLKKELLYLKMKDQKAPDTIEKEKWKTIKMGQKRLYKNSNKI
jgi:ribosome biogenesis GTPase / thiamine phosphate phosphatase